MTIDANPLELGRLLGVSEVAKWLQVSPAWVRCHASGFRRPLLPCVRMGGAIRFRREAIESFILDCERKLKKA